MISLVLIFCLAATCFAQYHPNQYNQNQYQPQQHHGSNNAAPVHYVSIGQQLQGDYKFGYNTGNDGSFREETRNPDGSVSGAYGYIDASGKQKIIRYTAGKDGFKAEGDDIPKPPPAPQAPAPHAAAQYNPAPHTPAQYNPAPYQAPAPQYQAPVSQYQPQPQPQYNNYIQHQPSTSYSQYAPPQQYGAPQQSGSYNPFSYHIPAAGQPVGSSLNQLSYNIGGGQPSHYQG